jgi:hypothetical protein
MKGTAAVLSLLVAASLVAQAANPLAQPANPPGLTTTSTQTTTTATAGSPPPAPAALPEGTLLPSEVPIGASVTQPVKNLAGSDRVSVLLNDGKRDYPASSKVEGSSVLFSLPSDIQPGRYTVRIVVNEKTILPVPGELRVAGAPQAAPVITGLSTPV